MVEQPTKTIRTNVTWELFITRSDFIDYYGDMIITDDGKNNLFIIATSYSGSNQQRPILNSILSIDKKTKVNTIFADYGFKGLYYPTYQNIYSKMGNNLYTNEGKVFKTFPPIVGLPKIIINNSVNRTIEGCQGADYHTTFYAKDSKGQIYLLDEFIKAYPQNDYFYSTTVRYNNDGSFTNVGFNYLGQAYGTDLVNKSSPDNYCSLPYYYFKKFSTMDNNIKTSSTVGQTGKPYWRVSIGEGEIVPYYGNNCSTNNPINKGYYFSKSYCLDLSDNDIPNFNFHFSNTSVEDLLIFSNSIGRATIIYNGIIISVNNAIGLYSASVFLDSNFVLWGVKSTTRGSPNVEVYRADLSSILGPIAKNKKTSPKLLSYNLKNDTRPVSITRGFIS